MRGPKIKDDVREYCCMTYKLHHKRMSFAQMAESCNISETSFRDIIKADQAVATNDWLYIVGVLDNKHRTKDNLFYAAKRHGWDFEELCAEARKQANVEMEKAKAQIAEQMKMPTVDTPKVETVNMDEVVARLDTIISLLQENKVAVENAIHTIPSNINSNITSEFENLMKKLNNGNVIVRARRY